LVEVVADLAGEAEAVGEFVEVGRFGLGIEGDGGLDFRGTGKIAGTGTGVGE
jgi:hypothetical protein